MTIGQNVYTFYLCLSRNCIPPQFHYTSVINTLIVTGKIYSRLISIGVSYKLLCGSTFLQPTFTISHEYLDHLGNSNASQNYIGYRNIGKIF